MSAWKSGGDRIGTQAGRAQSSIVPGNGKGLRTWMCSYGYWGLTLGPPGLAWLLCPPQGLGHLRINPETAGCPGHSGTTHILTHTLLSLCQCCTGSNSAMTPPVPATSASRHLAASQPAGSQLPCLLGPQPVLPLHLLLAHPRTNTKPAA